jgi:hypothetical protein
MLYAPLPLNSSLISLVKKRGIPQSNLCFNKYGMQSPWVTPNSVDTISNIVFMMRNVHNAEELRVGHTKGRFQVWEGGAGRAGLMSQRSWLFKAG